LLLGHPEVELTHCWSARETSPDPTNPIDNAPAIEAWNGGAGVDAVLLATPHGKSAPLAAEALDHGALVVDLSGDLRMRNQKLWESTYDQTHPCPGLLDEAVYGLTEWARDDIRRARLIANPGCYPTTVLLAIKPLLKASLLQADAPVISDSKSGVSGAGAGASAITHYGNVAENFYAYGVGTHRHAPEIEVHLGGPEVIFVPHLLPCYRGILSTLYLEPRQGVSADTIHAALCAQYENEPFVQVLPLGEQPALQKVRNTNRCSLAVAQVGSRMVVTSAIDNLLKGAAGQAVQNMNLALGLDETGGLL
jgi:N-acetyl-gamma-glutamyl-phosphate reductase